MVMSREEYRRTRAQRRREQRENRRRRIGRTSVPLGGGRALIPVGPVNTGLISSQRRIGPGQTLISLRSRSSPSVTRRIPSLSDTSDDHHASAVARGRGFIRKSRGTGALARGEDLRVGRRSNLGRGIDYRPGGVPVAPVHRGSTLIRTRAAEQRQARRQLSGRPSKPNLVDMPFQDRRTLRGKRAPGAPVARTSSWGRGTEEGIKSSEDRTKQEESQSELAATLSAVGLGSGNRERLDDAMAGVSDDDMIDPMVTALGLGSDSVTIAPINQAEKDRYEREQSRLSKERNQDAPVTVKGPSGEYVTSARNLLHMKGISAAAENVAEGSSTKTLIFDPNSAQDLNVGQRGQIGSGIKTRRLTSEEKAKVYVDPEWDLSPEAEALHDSVRAEAVSKVTQEAQAQGRQPTEAELEKANNTRVPSSDKRMQAIRNKHTGQTYLTNKIRAVRNALKNMTEEGKSEDSEHVQELKRRLGALNNAQARANFVLQHIPRAGRDHFRGVGTRVPTWNTLRGSAGVSEPRVVSQLSPSMTDEIVENTMKRASEEGWSDKVTHEQLRSAITGGLNLTRKITTTRVGEDIDIGTLEKKTGKTKPDPFIDPMRSAIVTDVMANNARVDELEALKAKSSLTRREGLRMATLRRILADQGNPEGERQVVPVGALPDPTIGTIWSTIEPGEKGYKRGATKVTRRGYKTDYEAAGQSLLRRTREFKRASRNLSPSSPHRIVSEQTELEAGARGPRAVGRRRRSSEASNAVQDLNFAVSNFNKLLNKAIASRKPKSKTTYTDDDRTQAQKLHRDITRISGTAYLPPGHERRMVMGFQEFSAESLSGASF